MALGILGATGQPIGGGADTTGVPLHVVARPAYHGNNGHYAVAAVTGAIAAGMAANGEVFQLRWADASVVCLIWGIEITGMRATTAFAAGTIDIKATIARSWSANGSGGTGLVANKLSTSFATTKVTDLRMASTAALGAGTKTLDSNDIGLIVTHSSGGVGSATPIIGSNFLPSTTLFRADTASGEHPIRLVTNEGIVVRATVPGTGIWNIGVRVIWAEVAAY